MVVKGAPRQRAIRVGHGPQVAGDHGEIGCLDGDIGAGADRDAEIGLRERGRVVDPVAHHRDASNHRLLQAGASRPPCRPAGTLGDHDGRRRSPHPRQSRRCGALSPVRRVTARPWAWNAATASAEVGLTRSATTMARPRLAAGRSDEHHGAAQLAFGLRCLPVSRAVGTTSNKLPAAPPGCRPRRSVPTTPCPGRFSNAVDRGVVVDGWPLIAWAIGCSDRASSEAASRSTTDASAPGSHHVDHLHAALGDRAGLVDDHDRVDRARVLEDLTSLDDHPELGAAARCRP